MTHTRLVGMLFAAVTVVLLGFGLAAKAHSTVVDLRGFHLAYATTEIDRERGLGGWTSLASDQGMLFVFGQSGIYPFWMKDMGFSLDIIWIDHGIVKDVATLHPPTSDQPAPEWHTPRAFADRVLEINAGEAKRLGIHSGVQLLLPEDAR